MSGVQMSGSRCRGPDVPHSYNNYTLLGQIMACFIMTGELWAGKNMAELVQNRQFFPVIILPKF